MKRKLLSVLLAVAMTVSLVACSGNNSNAEQQGDSRQENANEEQENPDMEQENEGTDEIDPNAAYEETVTLEVALYEHNDVKYVDGDTVTDNPWIRSYKEYFNIDVVPAFTAESADYSTKINLAIAERKLPDVCWVDAKQLNQLIEADMLYDMTEVFDTYASDTIKGYYDIDPESFESGMSDGKLYGLAKLSSGYLPQVNHVWIRKDWKEALNLEDPDTMDDFINIIKAFAEEYGSKEIMPVDSSLSLLYLLAPAWGAYPSIWVEDENGQIVYGATQPEMKEALAEWAKWYQEGFISADFATTNMDKIYEDSINGKLGAYPFYQWWGAIPGSDLVTEQGVNAHFEAYAIPTATGEEVLHPLSASNNGYVVVSKECEHPEAVMKLLNFYAYMDVEARIDDGMKDVAKAHNSVGHAAWVLRIENPNGETASYEAVAKAFEAQDASVAANTIGGDAYETCMDWLENKNPSSLGRYLQQGPEKSAYSVAKPIFDGGKVIKNKVWIYQPESLLEVGSTLNDILLEGFTKIIMGEESIDYFEDLVEEWKTAGGERVTNDGNEMYQ